MIYNVNDVFGPTIQGEGIYAGMRAFFIRLQGCDLTCRFCDTKESWNESNGIEMTSEEVVEKLLMLGLKPKDVVVITGGNPLKQNLSSLLKLLEPYTVQIETQGTILPDYDLGSVDVMISPKIGHMENTMRFYNHISESAAMPWLKFSITPEQLPYIDARLDHFGIDKDQLVFISCITTSGDDYMENIQNDYRLLCEKVALSSRNYVVMPQLHVIAWGHKKGV